MKDSMHPGRRDRRVLRHQFLLAAVNARPEAALFEADKPRPAPALPVFFTPANTLPPKLAAAPAVADLDRQGVKQTAPVERFSVTEESPSLLKSSESI
jgi:hypothetical protein